MHIEDYALIGDTRTAALVGRDGSVDWLCWPAFDSPACFAALVGEVDNGRWLLAPTGRVDSTTRRYRGDTMVLETTFRTAGGEARVVDAMCPTVASCHVVRLLEGVSGRVPMRMQLVLRPDYGSIVPWVEQRDGVLRAVAGPDAFRLDTPVALRGVDFSTVAEFEVGAGDRVPFVLQWHRSHEPPPARIDADVTIALAERWWLEWANRCGLGGRFRELAMRSLLVLKALTYGPTGGIVAAPTTSLPEQLGGVRNWDYRFCWLRDATFTLYALMLANYVDEARAWRDWLLRAVAGNPAEVQIMYGIAGERRLDELEAGWLTGYEGSRPVRIGNAAADQFQLDTYGEVMDALHQARRRGIEPDERAWALQRQLVEFVASAWEEPDEGIWEVRGPRRHFTHSKVMAWVAIDRAVKGVERFGLAGEVERWRRLRSEIHREVCQQGFSTQRNAFVQYYGSDRLDASLLMIPLVGFLPASDPRVAGTVKAIHEDLTVDGFVLRYATDGCGDVDGLPEGEGAFLACSFWLADNLMMMGRRREAQEVFDRLAGVANDVGLLAEEYDTTARRLVGNFPQAFSHISLVNTAWNLTGAAGPVGPRGGKNHDVR